MTHRRILSTILSTLLCMAGFFHKPSMAESLKEQNEALFRQLREIHGLTGAQMDAVRSVFNTSGYMGQGNPAITRHPATPGD